MLKIERVPEFSPLRDEIYRFRYEVFSHELHHHQEDVNHAARAIQDPMDDTCRLFAAMVDGKVVATIRWNAAGDSDLEECFRGMGIDGDEFEAASVTSKLAVAPSHRGTTIGYRLAAAALVDGLDNGIRFNIIRCEPNLVPFYERMGFRMSHRVRWHYAEWGEGVVMILDLHDEVYLRKVGSPLLRHYLAWAAQGVPVAA